MQTARAAATAAADACDIAADVAWIRPVRSAL